MEKTPFLIWCLKILTSRGETPEKQYLSGMSTYINPHLILDSENVSPGTVGWRSPSNLAIIKYWGKHGVQLPRNPSLSLTLSQAFTSTEIDYRIGDSRQDGIQLDFLFHGEPNEPFRVRLGKFLESLTTIYPFLRQLHLTIRSENSFPHSAGIASSASAMSALALCLCSMEHRLFGTLEDDDRFRRKASYLARLGSGSACRSVYAEAGFWGEHPEIEGSSDEYAVGVKDELHETFRTYCNDILIVSSYKKSVSSTAGHGLMDGHPYASARFDSAHRRVSRLLHALRKGDVEDFGALCESEALTLHGLMMSSTPPYMLLLPGTIEIINRIHAFRADTGLPLYFSLDAGPNPHLLYPLFIQSEVREFISTELLTCCEEGRFIEDRVGEGPEELIEE